MGDNSRKYFVVLVAILYVVSAMYLELGHTDILQGEWGGVHRITSHDCTNRETHQPLSTSDQCPICLRSSQTVPYISLISVSPFSHVEVVGLGLSLPVPPLFVLPVLSVRGPPTSIA